jgi:hypothetical protein
MAMTVAQYDAEELEARIGLSFSEIMAFSPRTFDLLGFPHRVEDERELVRYADWNRDSENQIYFKPGIFFGGPAVQTDFSHDEVAAMNLVRDQAVEVTRGLGRAVRPLCSPFAALGLFRIIEALRAACGMPTLRIFEVGPGSGYLGAMLINEGHYVYSSMDNSQAFSLWQGRLFQYVGGGDATTIPWWDFLKFRNVMVPADIVVSNSNLAEMTKDAAAIVAHHARLMLEASPMGLLLFASFGAESQNTNDGAHGILEKAGFRRVFDRLFRGYVVGNHQLPFDIGPLQADIPLYNPSGRPGTVPGAEAVYIPDDQRPLDLDVTELLEGWRPPT